jgi:hypothetical protein
MKHGHINLFTINHILHPKCSSFGVVIFNFTIVNELFIVYQHKNVILYDADFDSGNYNCHDIAAGLRNKCN